MWILEHMISCYHITLSQGIAHSLCLPWPRSQCAWKSSQYGIVDKSVYLYDRSAVAAPDHISIALNCFRVMWITYYVRFRIWWIVHENAKVSNFKTLLYGVMSLGIRYCQGFAVKLLFLVPRQQLELGSLPNFLLNIYAKYSSTK